MDETRHLTTGQIARLLGCSPRTVVKWIDNQLLKGFRLPQGNGSPGERRVTRAAFDAFCREHELMIVLPHGMVEGRGEEVPSPQPPAPSRDEDDDGPEPPPVAEAALDAEQFHRAA